VSETILDHGYIPQERAPDPIPPGKIGIWLFLASEIMFFVAILGVYVILRAGSPALFARHAAALGKTLAGINTLVLLISSFTMSRAVDAARKNDSRGTARFLALTILCALVFLGIKTREYFDKFSHHTIVARGDDAGLGIFVYDGHVRQATPGEIILRGYRMPMPSTADYRGTFDIHLVSENDVRAGAIKAGQGANEQEYTIPTALIGTDIAYGPFKNIFYACYFTLTGVHGLHVIAGMIPLLILCIAALRGKTFAAHTEYVGLYWYFVDLVWLFLFPLLYLI
jgi:cytochrome c oxidase subunit III